MKPLYEYIVESLGGTSKQRQVAINIAKALNFGLIEMDGEDVSKFPWKDLPEGKVLVCKCKGPGNKSVELLVFGDETIAVTDGENGFFDIDTFGLYEPNNNDECIRGTYDKWLKNIKKFHADNIDNMMDYIAGFPNL